MKVHELVAKLATFQPDDEVVIRAANIGGDSYAHFTDAPEIVVGRLIDGQRHAVITWIDDLDELPGDAL